MELTPDGAEGCGGVKFDVLEGFDALEGFVQVKTLDRVKLR